MSSEVVDQIVAGEALENKDENAKDVSPKKRKLEGADEEIEPKKAHTEDPISVKETVEDNNEETVPTYEHDVNKEESTIVAEVEVDKHEMPTAISKNNEETLDIGDSTDIFRQKFIDLFASALNNFKKVDSAAFEKFIFKKTGENAKSTEYLVTAFNALYKIQSVDKFAGSLENGFDEVDFTSDVSEDVKAKIADQVESELSDNPKDFDFESLGSPTIA